MYRPATNALMEGAVMEDSESESSLPLILCPACDQLDGYWTTQNTVGAFLADDVAKV